jgi:hypothetical protein
MGMGKNDKRKWREEAEDETTISVKQTLHKVLLKKSFEVSMVKVAIKVKSLFQ